MPLTLNPIGICAAEVTGIDCSHPLAEDLFAAIRKAYLTYPVLVFRDQSLTAPQMADFGRYFGKLEGYDVPTTARAAKPDAVALRQTDLRETPDQNLYVSPDDSDVLLMTNESLPELAPIGIVDNAEMWHSDGSHKPEPYQAILVHVLRNPACGGDTEFCDMRAVYEACPIHIRAALNGRVALHHWSKSRNRHFADTLDPAAREEGERIAQMIPEMRQPIVRTHPDTGRPCLYISPRFTLRIEDMPPDFSDRMLDGLFDLADDPRFHYRHEWREKDLMIWDNRCLNHRVRTYPASEIRARYRVTVTGDRPFFKISA